MRIEHPDIRHIEMTGHPAGYQEPEEYRCPICGREPSEMVFRQDGEVIGCDMCIKAIPYWDL